jgi:hypothetical protein
MRNFVGNFPRCGDSPPGFFCERTIMAPAPSEQELRDRFFRALLEATFPLQKGPDPEVALEALIEEHLRRELAELRQEQAE